MGRCYKTSDRWIMGRSSFSQAFFIILTLLPFSEAKSARFDIERRGDQVCKFVYAEGKRVESSPTCYPLSTDMPLELEVMDQVQELLAKLSIHEIRPNLLELIHTGGAIMLPNETLLLLNKNYRRISIRNFAVNVEDPIEMDSEIQYRFFADVYWQGSAKMEGTLHVEGLLILSDGPTNISDLFSGIVPMSADISAFSDSRTEQKNDRFRFLETLARKLHFTAINGIGTDTDKDTLRFLNEVIGPVIVGEVFLLPTINFIVEALPELSEALSDKIIKEILEGLGNLLNELSNTLDKPKSESADKQADDPPDVDKPTDKQIDKPTEEPADGESRKQKLLIDPWWTSKPIQT